MKTIEITANGVAAKLTLRSATIADDMRYGMLVNQALQTPRSDAAEQTVAVVLYPKCLAGLVEGKILYYDTPDKELELDAKAMTPADFLALPAALGNAWLEAARELNPQWFPQAEPPAEQEKKA